jgi:hypothetical protein
MREGSSRRLSASSTSTKEYPMRGRAIWIIALLVGLAACSSSTDSTDTETNEFHFSLYSFDTLRTADTVPQAADTAWWERNFPADSMAQRFSSVYFSARLASSDSTADCIADVYNLTDNAVIPGSEVRWSAIPAPRDSNEVRSGNLINAIPRKRVTLVLRIRSTKFGANVEARSAELVYVR